MWSHELFITQTMWGVTSCLVFQLQSAEVSRTVTSSFVWRWRSVFMLMKGPKILRAELNTVHLYQHYSLLMPNKLQYPWRGDYCECVRPVQLRVLTEVRAPSVLEQHPRYIPHRDRAGYNTKLNIRSRIFHAKLTVTNRVKTLCGRYGAWGFFTVSTKSTQ